MRSLTFPQGLVTNFVSGGACSASATFNEGITHQRFHPLPRAASLITKYVRKRFDLLMRFVRLSGYSQFDVMSGVVGAALADQPDDGASMQRGKQAGELRLGDVLGEVIVTVW